MNEDEWRLIEPFLQVAFGGCLGCNLGRQHDLDGVKDVRMTSKSVSKIVHQKPTFELKNDDE